MYFSWLASLIATFVTFAAHANEPPCRPFRVHMSAELPPPPKDAKSLAACVSYYTSLDQDRDGVRDWKVVEGTKGEVLAPADADLDGDGIENVLDPRPMTTDSSAVTRGIPAHLAMEGERGRLQREIFEKVGVIAIDHTDRHALAALEAFRDVAVRALSPGFTKIAPSLKYLYAFKGHDSRSDIAAYHRETRAISIGGEASWSAKGSMKPNEEDRVRILAALAHETGHAFLFDRMSPSELAAVGGRFGEWRKVSGRSPSSIDFYSPALLNQKHPLHRLAGLSRGTEWDLWSSMNIVSRYSTTNLHEWFADAFAAEVLNRLGERGRLSSPDWRKSIALAPKNGAWWANYNNVSPSFRMWLKSKLDPRTRASMN